MTFIEQFEAIKKKISKLDPTPLPHNLAMQVNLTDEDCGGTFYIANIGGNFAVEPYDYRDHTVMLTLSAKVFLDIMAGKLDATDALFRSLIELEGNIEHAVALADIAPKKSSSKGSAAKKTAEKKADSKKTASKKTTSKKSDSKKATTKKSAEKKTAEKKSTSKKATKE